MKKRLTGKILESGRFLLLDKNRREEGDKTFFTWKLEPLFAGHFPISLYKIEPKGAPAQFTPVLFVTVAPFEKPESRPAVPLLPLTPRIPPALSFTNQQLLAEMEQKEPARNLKELEAKTFPWLSAMVLLFAALAAPATIWYLKMKRESIPPPTPEEIALAELNRIKANTYPTADAFIVDLSQTVRQFIQNKYGLSAPYQTTEEFLQSTSKHPFLQYDLGQKLSLFLQASDQVKFAARVPSPREKETALTFASHFITQ